MAKSKTVFLYLQDKECKPPHMYFLPKIHMFLWQTHCINKWLPHWENIQICWPLPQHTLHIKQIISGGYYTFSEINQRCRSCSTKQLPGHTSCNVVVHQHPYPHGDPNWPEALEKFRPHWYQTIQYYTDKVIGMYFKQEQFQIWQPTLRYT